MHPFYSNVYSGSTVEKHENETPNSLRTHQRKHFKCGTLFSVWLCGFEWYGSARVKSPAKMNAYVGTGPHPPPPPPPHLYPQPHASVLPHFGRSETPDVAQSGTVNAHRKLWGPVGTLQPTAVCLFVGWLLNVQATC